MSKKDAYPRLLSGKKILFDAVVFPIAEPCSSHRGVLGVSDVMVMPWHGAAVFQIGETCTSHRGQVDRQD